MGRAKPQMVSLCFSTLQSFQWFLWIFSFINSCKLPTAQISHNSTKHCRDTFLWFVPAVWQYYTSCTVFRCCGLWSSLTDRMIYIRDASVPFFVHFGLLTTTPEVELPMGKAPTCLKDLLEVRPPEDTDIQSSAQGLHNLAFICLSQWDTQQRFGCSVRGNMKAGRLTHSKKERKTVTREWVALKRSGKDIYTELEMSVTQVKMFCLWFRCCLCLAYNSLGWIKNKESPFRRGLPLWPPHG